MTAFDTDVLSDLLIGHAAYTQRLQTIPDAERAIPIVAHEEVLRGRLDGIRKAQAGRIKLSLERAYDLFREALIDTRAFTLLPYTAAAHAQVQAWQSAKIRVGTNDMRIAAICVAHGATLATRNVSDYALLPGLTFEEWK
jgi:tRNA(fMet)-specific endonuclease VapC